VVGFLKPHKDHYLNKHERLEKYADVGKTMAVVKRKDPSIVLLMEVLEGKQIEDLTNRLRLQGYKSIYVGKGHDYGNAGGGVRLILATKEGSKALSDFVFDLPKKPGNGGGMVAIRIEVLDCLVIGVHWPRKGFDLAKKKYLEALMKVVHENKCKKIILMGDFNVTPSTLQESYPSLFSGSFSGLSLLSPNQPTCSNTFLIKKFYSKCIDVIYGKGLKVVVKKLVDTFSDHKAIYVELE
jgi:exonuclease III